MGNKTTLSLDERKVHGKKVAKLRSEGLVPGVVYGAEMEPISVQVAANVFDKTYRQAGTYTPVHLNIGSKKKIAMIKEVDIDPVRGEVRHVSFHAVKASDPVVAVVPVRLVGEGESEAEKNGLVVLQTLDQIEVKALPMDLPEAVEISILGLKEAGEKLTLAAAELPEGVEYVEHDDGRVDEELEEGEEKPTILDTMVASVWEPAALQAANEAAAGDAEDESEVESENGGDDEAASAEESEDKSE
ncbi:50S ribosomal protein L25 [Candidatus Nomurabacteria bacterium]|nr:50S ribosomal protein L25 [Candidatus Nomurabacteria bacterium]